MAEADFWAFAPAGVCGFRCSIFSTNGSIRSEMPLSPAVALLNTCSACLFSRSPSLPVVLLPGFILVALGLPLPVFEGQLALNQFVAFGGVRLLLLHSDVLLDPGDLEVLPCVKDLGSPPAAAD